MSKKIFILNGPNLNLLGSREPDIYGSTTLDEIEAMCRKMAGQHEFAVDFRQSNHEGVLIDWVQEANHSALGLIINGGGYTHTSVALHDALKALTIPIIEVHLSDPKAREKFRHYSYIEPVAARSISGQGAQGYLRAIEALATLV